MNNEQLTRALALIAAELHLQNEIAIGKKPKLSAYELTLLTKPFEEFISDNKALFPNMPKDDIANLPESSLLQDLIVKPRITAAAKLSRGRK